MPQPVTADNASGYDTDYLDLVMGRSDDSSSSSQAETEEDDSDDSED
ncbi:MAG: hypothetical protein KME15_27750 [Drouetiella hepatica Uher 2000/2452]|jgi:hypothetical protein|uniref:Uncharacterized protein n=1 Tax=Drouetiella hepatica Uher 2000/2452 TaxID=904376 RepID=A0A951QH25_9CYAN|nr:hypothetical protein [Drouetiella hepatica Uher 2000/2452]